MPKLVEVPNTLRAYMHHGIYLDWEGKTQALGDCPFCGREGKFAVKVETGESRCWGCETNPDAKKGGTNPISFIRRLWEESSGRVSGLNKLADTRGFLYPETLTAWGLCRSVVDDTWIVPAWTVEGKMYQLYRWDKIRDRRVFIPTPGIWPDGAVHGIFGIPPFTGRADLLVMEGFWDGAVMWETLGIAKRNSKGRLMLTSNESISELQKYTVVATPGCNVFNKKWVHLAGGKAVGVIFDNDHPKMNSKTNQLSEPVSYAGLRRVTKMLVGSDPVPTEIKTVQWSDDGKSHNPDLPDGYDVRDHITQHLEPEQRIVALDEILDRLITPPKQWHIASDNKDSSGRPKLAPMECTQWKVLVSHWAKALQLRPEIEDVLAVMMAVALSTDQADDQLFLKVVGDAGSAKSRLCDGMLVSRKCFPFDKTTGLYSGWKDASGTDFSMIKRINHKTLITSEGDTMVKSPNFPQLMSELRKAFDGQGGASFKNRNIDTYYGGLRTPWIMACTPAIMENDQSNLGDRFVKIWIDQPTEEEKQKILMQAGLSMLNSVVNTTNGQPDTAGDLHIIAAQRLSGGYVDHLRENPEEYLRPVLQQLRDDRRDVEVVDYISKLARFTASLRARPVVDRFKDVEHAAREELPTRLQKQFVRLAMCLAVVYNAPTITEKVLKLVRRVAIDTGRGRTLNLITHLWEAGSTSKAATGVTTGTLGVWMGETKEKITGYLRFLSKIRVVESFISNGTRWRLTDKTEKLYKLATR